MPGPEYLMLMARGRLQFTCLLLSGGLMRLAYITAYLVLT